jgi:hypothetical protein
MNPDVLNAWLKKKKSRGFAQNAFLGLFSLLAGLFILFLTFWLAYAIVWFGMTGVSAISDLIVGKKLYMNHGMRLACSGVFIILLFIQHLRTSPEYWRQYDKNDLPRYAPVVPMQSGILGIGMLLANPGTSANMVADILLVGPRWVTGGGKLIATGFRMKRLDENGCGELLAFLHSRPDSVPYEELKNAGWEPWFGQLRCIEGVLFLQKGLLLSTELRNELNKLSGRA